MGVFGKMQDVHYPSSGAVAQLGERDVRNVEVRGSIPLGSTTSLHHQKYGISAIYGESLVTSSTLLSH